MIFFSFNKFVFGYEVFCIGSKKNNVTFLTACSSIIGTSNYLVWSWKIYHQKMILKEPFSILEVPILRNLTTSSKFLLLQKITLVIAIKAQKYNNMLWIELKDYSKKQVNERIAIQDTIIKKTLLLNHLHHLPTTTALFFFFSWNWWKS